VLSVVRVQVRQVEPEVAPLGLHGPPRQRASIRGPQQQHPRRRIVEPLTGRVQQFPLVEQIVPGADRVDFLLAVLAGAVSGLDSQAIAGLVQHAAREGPVPRAAVGLHVDLRAVVVAVGLGLEMVVLEDDGPPVRGLVLGLADELGDLGLGGPGDVEASVGPAGQCHHAPVHEDLVALMNLRREEVGRQQGLEVAIPGGPEAANDVGAVNGHGLVLEGLKGDGRPGPAAVGRADSFAVNAVAEGDCVARLSDVGGLLNSLEGGFSRPVFTGTAAFLVHHQRRGLHGNGAAGEQGRGHPKPENHPRHEASVQQAVRIFHCILPMG